jgi:hypothetical protein
MSLPKWEECLVSWLGGRSFGFKNEDAKIEIVDLEKLLFDKGLIPDFILGSDFFYSILLHRIQIEMVQCFKVPRRTESTRAAFGGVAFVGTMNCSRMMLNSLGDKFHKLLLQFERDTGVNLEHWHQLEKTRKDSVTKKRKAEKLREDLCKEAKKGNVIK